MKKKNILMKVLALATMVLLVGNTVSVYGEEEDAEDRSISDHEIHELDSGTVVEPTCMEKGYTLYKCTVEGCTYEERRDEKEALGHDMKEIFRTENADGETGKITYECQRKGCSYQETVDVIDRPGTPKPDPSETPEPSEKPQKTETPTPVPTDKPEEKDDKDPSEETDPDTEDDAISYSSATSTDIVTEYDPETAYGTLKSVHKPDTVDEKEDIEGRTVPKDTLDITRDANGNLTDLAISCELDEIKNGYSVISEAETLKSISLVNKVEPGAYWITLRAANAARELGIRAEEVKKGLILIFTENKEPLYVTEVSEDKKNIILHMSSGGTCEIRKDVRDFTVDKLPESETGASQILLNKLKTDTPKIGFGCADAAQLEKKEKEYREKDYWLLPYDDQEQDPAVITVYEKIQDTY